VIAVAGRGTEHILTVVSAVGGSTRLRNSITVPSPERSDFYKKHIHDIRSNNSNTGYPNHILNTGHTYGTVQDTMEIITLGKNGKYLNALERYHIYKVSRDNLKYE
jgi:hypothetical protein